MKVTQIVTVDDLLGAWPFLYRCFVEGPEKADPDAMFKVISTILAHPERGWTGIVTDTFGVSVGCAIAEDATPAYSPNRLFRIRYLFHSPGRHDATTTLMRAFESWAKKQHIRFYHLITSRTSGSSIKCVRDRRYGFRMAHVVFEKEIK